MKRITIAFVIAMVTAAAVFGYGGGGTFSGYHTPYGGWYSDDLGIEYSGGYGYGASHSGYRQGGFGVVLHTEDSFVGAFGGSMQGHQLRFGPLTLSANLWTGFGYISSEISGSPITFGYFAEATADAGLAVLPWFQMSVYAGAQAIGPFDVKRIAETVTYSPVIGARLTWGSF